MAITEKSCNLYGWGDINFGKLAQPQTNKDQEHIEIPIQIARSHFDENFKEVVEEKNVIKSHSELDEVKMDFGFRDKQ